MCLTSAEPHWFSPGCCLLWCFLIYSVSALLNPFPFISPYLLVPEPEIEHPHRNASPGLILRSAKSFPANSFLRPESWFSFNLRNPPPLPKVAIVYQKQPQLSLSSHHLEYNIAPSSAHLFILYYTVLMSVSIYVRKQPPKLSAGLVRSGYSKVKILCVRFLINFFYLSLFAIRTKMGFTSVY